LPDVVNAINAKRSYDRGGLKEIITYFTSPVVNFPTLDQCFRYKLNEIVLVNLPAAQRRSLSFKKSFNRGIQSLFHPSRCFSSFCIFLGQISNQYKAKIVKRRLITKKNLFWPVYTIEFYGAKNNEKLPNPQVKKEQFFSCIFIQTAV